MPLSVIGAGFGRTGTMSLKLALEQLEFGPCHHMEEVFANPAQIPRWQAAVRCEAVDWADLYQGYGSTVDWPGAHFWRELLKTFPLAKVVLTTRSPESWWASYSQTIMKFVEIARAEKNTDASKVSRMCATMIGTQTFAADFTDRDAGLRAFQARVDDVTATVPPDRLLVFEVKQGWEPLCEFLDCPVPTAPFPRSNDRSEFWQNFSPAA